MNIEHIEAINAVQKCSRRYHNAKGAGGGITSSTVSPLYIRSYTPSLMGKQSFKCCTHNRSLCNLYFDAWTVEQLPRDITYIYIVTKRDVFTEAISKRTDILKCHVYQCNRNESKSASAMLSALEPSSVCVMSHVSLDKLKAYGIVPTKGTLISVNDWSNNKPSAIGNDSMKVQGHVMPVYMHSGSMLTRYISVYHSNSCDSEASGKMQFISHHYRNTAFSSGKCFDCTVFGSVLSKHYIHRALLGTSNNINVTLCSTHNNYNE